MFVGKQPELEELLMRCELMLDGAPLNLHDLYRERVKFICKYGNEGKTAIMTSLPSEKAIASVLLFCGIAAYYYNTVTVKQLIDKVQVGDTVLYKDTRVQVISTAPELKVAESKELKTIIPEKNWNQVVYYDKDTNSFTSVGVRKAVNSKERRLFFSELFGADEDDIVPEFNSISVIVADKDKVSNVIRNLHVRINGSEISGEYIPFLELFTATYVTSKGNEMDYPGNSWHGIPNLFICRDVSSAAETIEEYKDRYSLAALCFCNENALAKGKEQAIMMMNECGASFNIADIGLSYELGAALNNELKNKEVFQINPELNMKKIMERIDPILYYTWHSFNVGNIRKVSLPLDFSAKEYKDIIYQLRDISFDDDEPKRARFYSRMGMSLIHNLLVYLLPMEDDSDDEIFKCVFDERVKSLYDDGLAFANEDLQNKTFRVLEHINGLYCLLKDECTKATWLEKFLDDLPEGKKVGILVYKRSHIKRLVERYSGNGLEIHVMTQTSFDYSQHFDVLIIAGHMMLDKIPVWSHIYADDTYVLLYQCEERWFNYEMRKFKDNVIPLLGNDYYRFLMDDDINDSITPLADAYEDISIFDEGQSLDDLEGDFRDSFNEQVTHLSQKYHMDKDMSMAEIGAIGVLDDGCKYLFSKSKRHDVLNEYGELIQKSASEIQSGDDVFYCRDLGNREELLASLMSMDTSSDELKRAMKLTREWKRLLERYRIYKDLSYTDMTKLFSTHGVKITSQSLRGWVSDDSNLIGPRNEKVYQVIVKILWDEPRVKDWQTYARATEITRNMHNRTTNWLSDKIRELYIPYKRGEEPKSEVERMIYDNMDDLTAILHVENVIDADGLPPVFQGLLNRPIEWEDVIIDD